MSFLKLLCSLVLLLLCSLLTCGQSFDFKVGSGQASLEPGDNVISLALAGYGRPRDGRFTLKWEARGNLDGSINDMAFARDHLFVLVDGDIWAADTENGSLKYRVRNGMDVLLIASDSKRLYGLTKSKDIVVSKPGKKARWQVVSRSVASGKPVAFVVTETDFVVADEKGGVWRAERSATIDGGWEKIGVCEGTVDLVAHSDRLYALTDNELLYFEPDGNWLRVAIKNEFSYQQNMRRIASCGRVLYGFDKGGVYYRAGHFTDGNLGAGAVSIRKDEDHVVIIGLDVCGFDADFADVIKKELAERYRLPSSAVLINSSHTHFAPVTQRWTTWGEHCQRPDSLYLYTTVKRRILDAVHAAVRNEKNANLFFGREEVVIGHNRNLPGDNLPYDPALDVVRIDYENRDASDVMFLAGCHPVFNADERDYYKLSANYPGTARELLAVHPRIGRTFFLQGCGGDINPVDRDQRVTGRKVAAAVANVIDKGQMARIGGSISHFMDTVEFQTRPWSKHDLLALKAEKEKVVGDIYAEERVRWANLMLSYYQNGTMPGTMPVYVQTLNIGNWKLVGLSRETTTEYSLAIKNLWPDKLVTVAGYCTDISSYLPTSRHISAEIYEGKESFFWYSQPSVFPLNVHETIIDSIRTKNR